MKSLIHYTLAALLAVSTVSLFGNENEKSNEKEQAKEVKLLDKENSLTIPGATFIYGNQSGVSDEHGAIKFTYVEGTTLELSHINYGTWSLGDAEVKAALNSKVLYLTQEMINLYPVTIIALRPNEKPTEQVKLDYQDQMAHDGAAVLMQNPAINGIRKAGNYGFDPVFRGFKYDQLNIVLNGAQGATAACPNRMDPPTSQMAPNMMDRIEVLKGPHALRYGVGLGATLNFIPTKLRFTEEGDVYGRVSSGFDSNGSIFRNEAKVGFSGVSHDIAFFGAWSQGDDYTAGNGDIVQADFSRGSFGTNMGFKFSENNQIRVSAIYNTARDADFPALGMDLREDETWMFNVRHDIKFDRANLTSWNTTLFASFVDHKMDNLLKDLNPRMLNATTDATTFNWGGRTEGVWTFESGKLFAGADFRAEGAEGIRTREFLMGPMAGRTVLDNAWQDGEIAKAGAFGEYHYNLDKTRFVASARLELNTATINDPAPEFQDVNAETSVEQINPSFSVGAVRDLGEKSTVSLWVGRAQRSAGLTERFINYFPVGVDPFELLGNPNLDPEVNNQVDLNYTYKTDKTVISFDVFGAYMTDFISSVIDTSLSPRLPMSPGVRQFVNIDEAFKTGFEISWAQELAFGISHQMGVAYTYAQDLEGDEPLPEIAPLDFRYTLTGNYMDGRLLPQVSFRYVMEQDRLSTEFGETIPGVNENPTPSFTVVDVRVGFSVIESLTINAGVNNLLDENYFEHLTRNARGQDLDNDGSPDPIWSPGRNFFVSANYRF